jgi:excisionase family DNA binding protein
MTATAAEHMDVDEEYLTMDEACVHLDIGIRRLRTLIKRGELKVVRPTSGRIRIPRSEIVRLEEYAKSPSVPLPPGFLVLVPFLGPKWYERAYLALEQ